MSAYHGNRLALPEVARQLAVPVYVVVDLLRATGDAVLTYREGSTVYVSPAVLPLLRELVLRRRAARREVYAR